MTGPEMVVRARQLLLAEQAEENRLGPRGVARRDAPATPKTTRVDKRKFQKTLGKGTPKNSPAKKQKSKAIVVSDEEEEEDSAGEGPSWANQKTPVKGKGKGPAPREPPKKSDAPPPPPPGDDGEEGEDPLAAKGQT